MRQPFSTRPWQHVLEPLCGYLLLGERLYQGQSVTSSFNFGPFIESNRSVRELVEEAIRFWPGSWEDVSDNLAPHESTRLHLQIDKAYHQLSWRPLWSFAQTIERTFAWYLAVINGTSPLQCCMIDLRSYLKLWLMFANVEH